MTRKEAILNMHQVLIKRRDALRKALAGDLSLLKELRAQASGDVVDAALDSVQDEISSQLAEVESRELARIEIALERMREGQYGICDGCSISIPKHSKASFYSSVTAIFPWQVQLRPEVVYMKY